jgi:hypothetical protein
MAIEKIKVLGAEYLSYVKFIATYVLTFFGYIISVLASVDSTVCNTVINSEPSILGAFKYTLLLLD